MSDFKPIETQEQLNSVIRDRLEQKERAIRKEYEEYLHPDAVAEKYKGYLSLEEVQEMYKGYIPPEEAQKKDALIKSYELNRTKAIIAQEYDLPYGLGERIIGETEEEMRNDARKMARCMKEMQSAQFVAPLRDPDSGFPSFNANKAFPSGKHTPRKFND